MNNSSYTLKMAFTTTLFSIVKFNACHKNTREKEGMDFFNTNHSGRTLIKWNQWPAKRPRKTTHTEGESMALYRPLVD